MKKLTYILISVAVIAIGYFSFKFFFGSQPQPGNQLQSGLLPNPSTPSAPPADYSIANTFPTTQTITIGTKDGTVEMKNFYATAVDTEEGSVILRDADEYKISYNRGNSGFLLFLKNPSSKDVRQNAEADFLNILGISQADACKLNVQVLAPQSQFVENPNLRFCLGNVQ